MFDLVKLQYNVLLLLVGRLPNIIRHLLIKNEDWNCKELLFKVLHHILLQFLNLIIKNVGVFEFVNNVYENWGLFFRKEVISMVHFSA